MVILSLAIGMLTVALISLGYAGPLAWAGLAVLGTALVGLAAAFALIKTEDLEAVATLGKAISETTTAKSIAFTASMVGMADVMKEAKSAGVITVAMLASMVKPFAAGTPEKGAAAAPTPFKQHKMKETPGSKVPQTITVNFEIGGDKFATKVVKIVDERLNLAKA